MFSVAMPAMPGLFPVGGTTPETRFSIALGALPQVATPPLQ
jgi:hypothetical protein